ncbi:MAG: hypothetical protein ACD_19C00426G0062 [uncultured bacterium]|nr:MAG: hypothetical protein ACD_19C00426G0062 [uncultured bacterium]
MQTVTYEDQIVQLQSRWVFTLPRNLREDFFDENRLAKISRVGRKIVIEPLTTLPYSVRRYADSEVDDFFDLDDEESKELKTKGII